MNVKLSVLRDATALAIAISMTCAAMVKAQEPADEARTLDAITVTGSRISVPGVEASSPVAAVERAEFLTAQPVAVESFLKEFPALTPSIGPGTNNGTGGGATINMRGLGDNRTLVLVDGRRPVPFNLDNVVDTNTIPMSLLQSVEMLTGGASVVYGADAVAGVTNFILRRDFEGVEFNMNWGQTTRYHDGARKNYEITFGALSDDGRANAVLSVGFTDVDPVQQGARPWSVVSKDSVDGTPGGSITTVPAVINVTGSGFGNLQINSAGRLVPIYDRFNYNPLNFYQTALDRWQATGLARYEFNWHAEAYAQVNYTRSQVNSAWAQSGIFGQTFDVPLGNPYIPGEMRQQICDRFSIAASDCVEGSPIPVNMSIYRRLTELGARLNNFDTKTFQATMGLRGALNADWNYDAYWSYGESDQLQAAINWGSLSKVRQALNALNKTACLDPSNGCVPLNPFAGDGTILQDQLDFINLNAFAMQAVEQTNAAFNLDGSLGRFKSPWTDYPIGIAAGIEYRRTQARTSSDTAFQTRGEVMGGGIVLNSRGGFSIKEGYIESIVPVVSGRPGAENLSLELGYRHSEFSNTGGFGDNYGSWKYGLTWTPVGSLKFRAMQQRATRAPNISELFQPEFTGGDNLTIDPCAQGAINMNDAIQSGTLSWLCVKTGVPISDVGNLAQPSAAEVNVLRSGNLRLSPEEADTTTVGLVWTPTDRLSITVDYWNIEINKAISTPAVQDVVTGCYDETRNPGFTLNDACGKIWRNTANGTFNGLLARGIELQLSNSGFIQKTGVDLGVRFAHDLPGSWGQLQYALDLSKVSRDNFRAAPESILRDCLGYYSTSCSPSHDLRTNLRATWLVGDFSVTLAWRYFGALDVEELAEADGRYFEPYRHIPAYHYFDLGASWNTPWNTRISLSVNNVLDKKPPLVGGDIGKTTENSGDTFPQWYDPLGRYLNLGVSFKF